MNINKFEKVKFPEQITNPLLDKTISLGGYHSFILCTEPNN